MTDLKYNKELYYKELSHYFAFAVIDMFRVEEVSLMMNNDDFVHAFVEIMPGYYLDAKGVFYDSNERSDFKFTEIVAMPLKQAQEFLKKHKIKYTDVNCKKCVREYLRNNMLTFDYLQNGYTYAMGICSITYLYGKYCVLTYSYDTANKQWGSYIHTIPLDVFVNNIQSVHGFIQNKGWYYKK